MTASDTALAVRALRENGFVVLPDVIDPVHIASLREKMLADLPLLLTRRDAPFNFNTGNIQQEPPPYLPYLFRDILFNDQAIAVTKALLGPGLKNVYYSGNTTVPGSGTRQPVHPDNGQLWPNLEQATPPFAFVVNVPVVDMNRENGSTELWPGTHLDTTLSIDQGDIKVPIDAVEARRKIRPPVQLAVQAGSIVLRDIRLWHAGMPNRTQQPRPMIAMIHTTAWWGGGETLTFPKGTEEFFQHPDLHTQARFTEEPIDYLHHSQAYDFTPGEQP